MLHVLRPAERPVLFQVFPPGARRTLKNAPPPSSAEDAPEPAAKPATEESLKNAKKRRADDQPLMRPPPAKSTKLADLKPQKTVVELKIPEAAYRTV